jgi:hypothetical protein
MRSVPKTLLRRLGALERAFPLQSAEDVARRNRSSFELVVAEIDGEKARRLSPHRLPPARCSLATLVYRWGSHWATDDPAPADLERELLRRLKDAPPNFLAIVDMAERYREAMIAGDPERFFRWPPPAETKERWCRFFALSEAAERGDVPRESVPLVCRPIPDDIDGEPTAPSGDAGRQPPPPKWETDQ